MTIHLKRLLIIVVFLFNLNARAQNSTDSLLIYGKSLWHCGFIMDNGIRYKMSIVYLNVINHSERPRFFLFDFKKMKVILLYNLVFKDHSFLQKPHFEVQGNSSNEAFVLLGLPEYLLKQNQNHVNLHYFIRYKDEYNSKETNQIIEKLILADIARIPSKYKKNSNEYNQRMGLIQRGYYRTKDDIVSREFNNWNFESYRISFKF
jgi:hypothetical protein